MHRNSRIVFLAVAMTFAFAGCESHQAKIDALQKEYDDLSAQMKKDCSAEYLKVPPTLSPNCTDENKKVTEAWNKLQAERNKQ